MAINELPRSGRETKPHIGIYGRCNVGKSTLLNFITEGDYALVSAEPGTTGDPVRKSYEILDFAPVIFIDTAGLDDSSPLGARRIEKTRETIPQIDLALLVFRQWGAPETALATHLERDGVPFLLIHNRFDDSTQADSLLPSHLALNLSHNDAAAHEALLTAIRRALPERSYLVPSLFEGRVERDEVVLLVCPIDSEAPSGRMILPQVQAIRHLLDKHAVAVVVQPEQIESIFARGLRPKLVVTDSQAFAQVRATVPAGVEITSFSILLAQLKGDPVAYAEGLVRIDTLRPGDKILILENCIHQSSCEDIGRVKIPALLEARAGGTLPVTVVSGLAPLPPDLASYALAVQCGGCMVTRSQLQNRIRVVLRAGVPITNYGMLLNRLL